MTRDFGTGQPLQRTDGGDVRRRRAHPGRPAGEIHPQPRRDNRRDGETRRTQHLAPFAQRIVAHVRGVAQQFHRLQMGVGSGRPGGDHIDKNGWRAVTQHAAGLAKASGHIAPMVGGKSAGEEVKRPADKGQGLGRADDGGDVVDAAPPGFGAHGGQHILRQVAGGHLPGVRGNGIADMPAATAQIERGGRCAGCRDFGDTGKVGTGGMHGTGHIISGGGTKLALHQTVVGDGHGVLLFPLCEP